MATYSGKPICARLNCFPSTNFAFETVLRLDGLWPFFILSHTRSHTHTQHVPTHDSTQTIQSRTPDHRPSSPEGSSLLPLLVFLPHWSCFHGNAALPKTSGFVRPHLVDFKGGWRRESILYSQTYTKLSIHQNEKECHQNIMFHQSPKEKNNDCRLHVELQFSSIASPSWNLL